MEKIPYDIAPAFRKMPRFTIANKRWLLRFLSFLIRISRVFYRWPEDIVATEHSVQSSDDSCFRIIEIAPKGLQGNAPAIVYYHGGGFFLTYGRLHLKQAEVYAKKLQVRVFFVQYRLSTQQPFPSPLNDCVAALAWVYDNAQRLRVNPERVAVMGDSAGGCLAAAVAQHVHDDNKQRQIQQIICAQFLIYPALDSDCKTPSALTFDDTPLWNSTNNKIMWQVYLDDARVPGRFAPPPYASPAHRGDLSGLPPAYIESAEFDPLRDEAHEYGDALTAAGVEVRRAMVSGAVHGYDAVDCDVTRNAKANRLETMRVLLGN